MGEPKGYIGYCDGHGKRLFTSRRIARQQINRHRNSKGLRAYRCELIEGHWHIGHLPLAVVAGEKTAGEIYGSAS